MFSKSIYISLCLSVYLLGCNRTAPVPSTIRLSFEKSKTVEGKSPERISVPARTEWKFNTPPSPAPEKFASTYGWEAGPGTANLEIKDGRLTGKSTNSFPMIHFERTPPDDEDTLYSIEVRARVSAGANLRIGTSSEEKVNFPQAEAYFRDFPVLTTSTPLIAGDKITTYTMKPKFNPASNKIRHIVIMPVDQAGAVFEIESIRFIFRKEYLAAIPSGTSWQALSGIYHDTVVARTPEVVKMNVTLPERPWLDLNIGTIEDGPILFRVGVGQNGKEDVMMERTVTRSHHWETAFVDLSRYGREKVTLSFSLAAENKGMIGFWGSPVVRSHANASRSNETVQGVIIVWSDTLRKDHLDAYGYKRPTGPNIRRMAQEGTIFKDCISQATWTKVASPTLMTSLYPSTHGVKDFTDRLPASATTLAEVFQNAGYATVDFSSNLFTATFSNFHQGFDEVHEDSSLPNPNSSKTAREYMDRMLPWLTRHRDVPFFVFLHAYDAHDPYEPYAPYNTLWADPSGKKEHQRQLEEVRKVIRDPLMKAFGMPNREELLKAGFDPEAYASYDRDWYDGSIRGLDAEVGRLLEFLRSNKMDHRTLVVFAADHGEEFLEHGKMFHGQTVYGELTNVPLIFWKPGTIPAGGEVMETVETVDVMPTILEFSATQGPQNMQGRSLVPLITRNRPAKGGVEAAPAWSEPAISEKALTKDNAAPAPHDTESYSIVLDGWRLIHNTKRHAGTPEFELYDHLKDPLNKTDVASQNPEIVRRLSKILDSWHAKTTAARLKPDATTAKELSQEELERLRSLGYIQ